MFSYTCEECVEGLEWVQGYMEVSVGLKPKNTNIANAKLFDFIGPTLGG